MPRPKPTTVHLDHEITLRASKPYAAALEVWREEWLRLDALFRTQDAPRPAAAFTELMANERFVRSHYTPDFIRAAIQYFIEKRLAPLSEVTGRTLPPLPER